jgi:hypothetical protein
MHMIREHTGQPLETWLSLVEESTLPAFKSFAKGIEQDKAAVFAGLTLPWSNGPVEGHVNRLKLMKRSMYGRAKLPLLRQRVLHDPKGTKARKGKSERSRDMSKSPTLSHLPQSGSISSAFLICELTREERDVVA